MAMLNTEGGGLLWTVRLYGPNWSRVFSPVEASNGHEAIRKCDEAYRRPHHAATAHLLGLSAAVAGNRHEAHMTGRCAFCGGAATSFSDELSRTEYRISGLCQSCQDKVFVPTS